jgi:magnesium-transporting ATPase (P-type)
MNEKQSVIAKSDSRDVVLRNGLTNTEVMERRKVFGLNKLPEKEGRSPLSIFLA